MQKLFFLSIANLPESFKNIDHLIHAMSHAGKVLNCRSDPLQLNSILPFSAYVLFRRSYRILNVTPQLELSFRLTLSLLCSLLRNLTLRRSSLLEASSKQLFSTRRHATQSWYRLAAQTQHVDSKGGSFLLLYSDRVTRRERWTSGLEANYQLQVLCCWSVSSGVVTVVSSSLDSYRYPWGFL